MSVFTDAVNIMFPGTSIFSFGTTVSQNLTGMHRDKLAHDSSVASASLLEPSASAHDD